MAPTEELDRDRDQAYCLATAHVAFHGWDAPNQRGAYPSWPEQLAPTEGQQASAPTSSGTQAQHPRTPPQPPQQRSGQSPLDDPTPHSRLPRQKPQQPPAATPGPSTSRKATRHFRGSRTPQLQHTVTEAMHSRPTQTQPAASSASQPQRRGQPPRSQNSPHRERKAWVKEHFHHYGFHKLKLAEAKLYRHLQVPQPEACRHTNTATRRRSRLEEPRRVDERHAGTRHKAGHSSSGATRSEDATASTPKPASSNWGTHLSSHKLLAQNLDSIRRKHTRAATLQRRSSPPAKKRRSPSRSKHPRRQERRRPPHYRRPTDKTQPALPLRSRCSEAPKKIRQQRRDKVKRQPSHSKQAPKPAALHKQQPPRKQHGSKHRHSDLPTPHAAAHPGNPVKAARYTAASQLGTKATPAGTADSTTTSNAAPRQQQHNRQPHKLQPSRGENKPHDSNSIRAGGASMLPVGPNL